MRIPGNPSDRRRRDENSGIIRTEFDWTETPPAVAVVETLAVATDTELLGVESLVDHLDPDALNTLIRNGDRDGSHTAVVFGMAGHEVFIHTDGRLVVTPIDLQGE